MVHLNPRNVPNDLLSLIPLAESWGIRDEGMREDAIESASLEQLEELVQGVRSVRDEALMGWLTSAGAHPTDEYVAITCLTMAYHAARYRLKSAGR
jgi:hypothetical protein